MVGLAASPLWVSQGILITHFAMLFAEKRGDADGTAHVGFFNGIFSGVPNYNSGLLLRSW